MTTSSVDDDLRLTAYHEAGHAVADMRAGFTPAILDITPRNGKLGGEGALGAWNDEPSARLYVRALLAGYAAEVRSGGDPDRARGCADDDFAEAERVLGLLDVPLEHGLADALSFVAQDSEWKAIEALAGELYEHRILDDTEIDLVIAIADGEPGAEEALAGYRARHPR